MIRLKLCVLRMELKFTQTKLNFNVCELSNHVNNFDVKVYEVRTASCESFYNPCFLIAGNEGAGDRYEQFNSSSSMHATSMLHNHIQPLPPAGGQSGWAEEHNHLLSSKPDEPVTGISDQPLNFSHHFNCNLDQHMQSNYTHPLGGPVRGLDPSVSISSNYAWTPSSASGIVHPPTISSGAQVLNLICTYSCRSMSFVSIFDMLHCS